MDKLPEIGQLVKVKSAVENGSWYSTRVEERTADSISIGAPIRAGELVPYSIGSRLNVQFEQPDALYSFSTSITGRRVIRGSLRLYDLARPEEVRRFQRRQMFRLSLILDVDYQVASLPTDDDSIPLKQKQKGTIKDISGGGLRLAAKEELPEGAVLEVIFPEDSLGLTLATRIVNMHVKEDEDTKTNKYGYGLQFLDLDRATQDKIISFIFEEQRRRRQRELAVQ